MIAVGPVHQAWALWPSGAVSSLGAGPPRTLLAGLVVAVLALERRWRAAAYVLTAVTLVHMLDRAAKHLVALERPPDPQRGYSLPNLVVVVLMASVLVAVCALLTRRRLAALWFVPGAYLVAIAADQLVRVVPVGTGVDSFPSGHASNSMALALAVVAVRPRGAPWAPWCYAIVGAAVVVGISRVTLGFHRPTDVLAGWFLAVVVTTALQPLFGVRWAPEPAAVELNWR
ncbi:phosphatase PAP2 family protein [Aquihabitans sp. McL0605]|uniref:phosphatase PAP2 family protein n=1 Tax=Aquihabitans sp. McL0605 TaxID=3415671 RepID=UPI003CF53773